MMKNYIWTDAVLELNPDVKFFGNLDDITWLNGTSPISQSDIETKLTELRTIEATTFASAKAKLKALGLTDAELTALFGD